MALVKSVADAGQQLCQSLSTVQNEHTQVGKYDNKAVMEPGSGGHGKFHSKELKVIRDQR